MTGPHSGNLADLVRSAAERRGDGAAFVHRGSTLTWAEVDAAVDAAAAGLLALGLAPGDRVGIHLANTPDFPVAYFGVLRAGLVAVPLNPGYTRDELAHALGDSGARALVTTRGTSATAQVVAAEVDALEHLVVTGVDTAPPGATTWDALLAGGGSTPVDSDRGGEDLAVLIYTSGTSGKPKGAMLPHRALLANLGQGAQIDPPVITPDDIVLLVLPLFHIYGLNAGLGAVAREAATGVLVERFDPVETLAEIRRHEITSVLGAPPMYVAWSMLPDVGDAFSTVRVALSGAAPLPGPVLHRILDITGHHVFEGYGLTETAPVLTSTLMSEVAKPFSIGRPIPGVELRLVDERGHEVDEDGDPGEICVRGANLFLGYWPDATEGPDADGWFATGDIAVLDDDGDLFLVDRRKELILVSGFNVYPREVEDVLAAHPDVEEAAVLGVAHPYTGESVKALVVLKPGARVAADDLIAHCARSLARFKCPTSVDFVPELPHSATGKVSKGRLRERSA
ncbi:MAG: AMP-dependent synthetase and ligase [Frankiales bacterium]|nr:AMP-dependent synthetase and ligase [Frankiales bacterium]